MILSQKYKSNFETILSKNPREIRKLKSDFIFSIGSQSCLLGYCVSLNN